MLVDTHAFLWFVFDDARLATRAAEVLSNPAVTKVVSVVSLWEIAIKTSLGRLVLGIDYERFVSDFVLGRDLVVLGVEVPHLVRSASLPWHHRDPFDRLLVAQSLVEGLALVTRDSDMPSYGVTTVWM